MLRKIIPWRYCFAIFEPATGEAIAKHVEKIAQMAQENSMANDRSAEKIRHLDQLAETLLSMTVQFKLK